MNFIIRGFGYEINVNYKIERMNKKMDLKKFMTAAAAATIAFSTMAVGAGAADITYTEISGNSDVTFGAIVEGEGAADYTAAYTLD